MFIFFLSLSGSIEIFCEICSCSRGDMARIIVTHII